MFYDNNKNKWENIIGDYIEFFPHMDKIKNHVVYYLLKNGKYNNEEKIIRYLEEKLSNEEKKFLLFYMMNGGGFNNMLKVYDIFEINLFQKNYQYKLLNKFSNNSNNINNNDSKMKRLDKEIEDKVKELLPRPEDKENLKKFENKVKEIILNRWPNQGLEIHPFGSAVNGLWSNKSDVDLCICVDHPEKCGINRMRKIASVLRKAKMKNIIPIQQARMPICKFTDPETGFNCDLSVNNCMPLYNSKLIYCYINLDPRVHDIIRIIKKWSKIKNINDSKSGTFCSYAYVLLCIAFFQYIQPPVLPNLQDPKSFPKEASKFLRKKEVEVSCKLLNKKELQNKTFKQKIEYFYPPEKMKEFFKSENTMSTSELLIELFKFYGTEYRYEKIVCSISSPHGFCKRNNKNKFNEFAIQDPFIQKRDIVSNCSKDNKKHIINEFQKAYNILTKPNAKLEDIFIE